MTRRYQVPVQPIGFLARQGTLPTPQVPSSLPFFSQPPIPGPPLLPFTSNLVPSSPVAPSGSGLTGITNLVSSLFKGKGSVDLLSMMSNAQKVIGVVNQLGTAVRNMAPMLEMLKSFGANDGGSELDDNLLDAAPRPPTTKKRKRKKRTASRNKKTRQVNRKRSKNNP